MVPRKDNSRDRSARAVKFASTEADQSLLKLVDQALEERSVSFSDLCKQALQHFLRSPELTQSVPLDQASGDGDISDGDTSSVSRLGSNRSRNDVDITVDITALHNQMHALRLQVAKLEGALGMYQTVSLGQVEQQVAKIDQNVTAQLAQVLDRLNRLEQVGSETQLTHNAETSAEISSVESIELPQLDPPQREEPEEIDPLLIRLAPLLDDF